MTPDRSRVVVIGGGVIGCAILREFARRGVAGTLIETEPDVCEGTSKANSAILHTGFDSKPGTIESSMLRRAAELWPATIEELGVPFLEVGALMLARTADEAARLTTEIGAGASALGVTTQILDRVSLRREAPYLADDVVAALSIPGEAVVDPFWLTRAYAEAALAGGAEIILGHAVVGLDVDDDAVIVGLDDGSLIRADQVIDAAGLWADDVARLAGDDSFTITPRVGQFLVSEEAFGVDRIVLPIPGPMGKGMLVTPIVFGGLLLGPTAVDRTRKDDRSTDPAAADRILEACRAMVPAVAEMVPIRQFAGLRHVSSTGDFIVRRSGVGDRLFLAAGIRSTGISTSPAVAETVVEAVFALRGWSGSTRPLIPAPTELPDAPGEIVCLCRSISQGEVEMAARRPTAPRTLDAIKRRGGAMFGDCQGNLCAVDVARIVGRERGLALTGIEKHRRGSWLWETIPDLAVDGSSEPNAIQGPSEPQVTHSASNPRVADGPIELPAEVDIVVVGGGRAGRAAADAAAEHGCRVVGVTRDAMTESADPSGIGSSGDHPVWLGDTTVVGLIDDDGGWLVLIQDPTGAREVRARSVVLATGAYVVPREHRSIGGPRPAGVMTSDQAIRILAAGLRPGAVAALVGEGPRADALADPLGAAGIRVVRLMEPPEEIRGEIRLEGARIDGRWIEVDTLILADRLLPQAFLLRSLGLIDARPDSLPPVDAGGRLPLDGLWAAGCCVAPSLAHDGCATSGAEVGARAADALAADAHVVADGAHR